MVALGDVKIGPRYFILLSPAPALISWSNHCGGKSVGKRRSRVMRDALNFFNFSPTSASILVTPTDPLGHTTTHAYDA